MAELALFDVPGVREITVADCPHHRECWLVHIGDWEMCVKKNVCPTWRSAYELAVGVRDHPRGGA